MTRRTKIGGRQTDIHLYVHNVGDEAALNAKLDKVLTYVINIDAKERQILMTEQEALAAIQKVADITTKIGTNVGAEADTLQKISDEVDSILKSTPSIPSSVSARLQTLADATQAVSDNLDTHQAILEAILAKGQPAVPPTPVPAPTPAP